MTNRFPSFFVENHVDSWRLEMDLGKSRETGDGNPITEYHSEIKKPKFLMVKNA